MYALTQDFSAVGDGITVVIGASRGADEVTIGVVLSMGSLMAGGWGNFGCTVLTGAETSSTTVEVYAGVWRGLKRTVEVAALTTTMVGLDSVLSAGAEGSGNLGSGSGGSRIP